MGFVDNQFENALYAVRLHDGAQNACGKTDSAAVSRSGHHSAYCTFIIVTEFLRGNIENNM